MGLRELVEVMLNPHSCGLRSVIQEEIRKNCALVHDLVGDCPHDCSNCHHIGALIATTNYEQPMLPFGV